MQVSVDPNDRIHRRGASMPSPSHLIEIPTVAQILGTTRRHVQRLVSERRIPYLKVGRFIRFDPCELSVWLDEQRVAMHVPPYPVAHTGR
jgi:excisionase family DNA binding protein